MPRDPGGVWSGTSGLSRPSRLLVQAQDGGSCGWKLRGGVPRIFGDDPGGPTVLHQFQYGGGSIGESMGLEVWEIKIGGVGGGIHHAAFFYADDGLVASTYPICMHGVFNTLTRLFDRVGIREMSGRQLEYSSAPVAQLGTRWRWITRGG